MQKHRQQNIDNQKGKKRLETTSKMQYSYLHDKDTADKHSKNSKRKTQECKTCHLIVSEIIDAFLKKQRIRDQKQTYYLKLKDNEHNAAQLRTQVKSLKTYKKNEYKHLIEMKTQ